MELLFDTFSLSDSEIVKKRAMTLTGTERKFLLTKKLLANLVDKLVSDSYGFSLDKPENKAEGATRVTFQRYIRLDKSYNTV